LSCQSFIIPCLLVSSRSHTVDLNFEMPIKIAKQWELPLLIMSPLQNSHFIG
jgi:hypothetical protein